MDRKAAENLVQAITPYVTPYPPPPPLLADATPAPSATTPAPSPPRVHSPPLPSQPDIQGLGIGMLSSSATSSDAVSSGPDQEDKPQYLDDDHSDDDDPEPLFAVAPLLKDSAVPHAATVLSIRLENCGLKSQALEALGSLLLWSP